MLKKQFEGKFRSRIAHLYALDDIKAGFQAKNEGSTVSLGDCRLILIFFTTCTVILVHLPKRRLPPPIQEAGSRHKEHTEAWNFKKCRKKFRDVINKIEDWDA